MDAVRTSLRKREARLALSAWFHILRRIGAVYHLGKDAGSRRLSDTARSAEKVCMSQLASQNRILECLGYIVLADEGPEGIRPVFSC